MSGPTTYSTNAEVVAEFRGLTVSDSGTVILNSDLDTWRSTSFGEINAKVGVVYTTPVDDSFEDAFAALKAIEILLVKAKVREKLNVSTQSGNLSQSQLKDWAKEARALLAEIQKGTYPLPGLDFAEAVDTGDGVSSSFGDELKYTADRDYW